MKTWFKVYRDLFESSLWHDVVSFRLFLYLIAKAAHQNYVHIAGLQMKQGQYVRSYRKIAEDLAYKEGRGCKTYSTRTIKRAIDKLVQDGRITKEETELGTLFTIVNYAYYQGLRDITEPMVNRPVQESETISQQSGNDNNNANNARLNKHIREIAALYGALQKRFSRNPVSLTRNDYYFIEITLQKVSVAFCKKFLHECFGSFAARNADSPHKKITSFKYCMLYILDHYQKHKAEAESGYYDYGF